MSRIFIKIESDMKMQSALHRILQALFITGISIFVLAPAFAVDPVKVTADNYVRAEGLGIRMIDASI